MGLAPGPLASLAAAGGSALTAGRRAHNYRVSQWQWPDAMASAVMLTERAARRVGQILKGEPPGSMLRVSVEGGGCSGFQYKFDLVDTKAEDDLVLARDGATVLVDPVSVQYMAGAEIDFVDDLIGASFKINNPVATSSCGCGTSFSV
jgi:iron-sulfur cluster assembly accessory protein